MYDELVGRLREPCQYENCILCQQAADAIEELSKDRDNWKATAKEEREEYWHWFDQYQKDVHRWIPVTERLPEKFENCLIANKRGKHYDIDKGWWNGSFFDRCAKGSYSNVTHWMPLPELPKEE